jgi:hypothetical protein
MPAPGAMKWITTTAARERPQHGGQEVHGEDRCRRLQVIGCMAGDVVSRGPDALHDEHRQEEDSDWPSATREVEDAIGHRPRCSGHL